MILAAVSIVALHASIALGPDGSEGRWGLSYDWQPHSGALGWSIAAGAGVVGGGDGDDGPTRAGAWIAPSLRAGYFGARDRVSLFAGVGLTPLVNVFDGGARLTLRAEPGFRFTFDWFAFGMAMTIGSTVGHGVNVGVAFQIGATF